MCIDPKTGLLQGAIFRPSPNCDARPNPDDIDLIVIHGISLPPGQFGGPWVEALFTNRLDPNVHPYFHTVHGLKVSAHLLIRRDGETIQFVPFHLRAWHAGVSSFAGRANCNDFSIGIELEGADYLPYEGIQYERLAQVTRVLCTTFPKITGERIVGHSTIAPNRKSDPGPNFRWDLYQRLLGSTTEPSSSSIA